MAEKETEIESEQTTIKDIGGSKFLHVPTHWVKTLKGLREKTVFDIGLERTPDGRYRIVFEQIAQPKPDEKP
jgi:hypothetical protein